MKRKGYQQRAMDAVYDFIVEYAVEHGGNSPSIRTIQAACGHSSTAMTYRYLDMLVGDGRIERKDGKLVIVDAEFSVRTI